MAIRATDTDVEGGFIAPASDASPQTLARKRSAEMPRVELNLVNVTYAPVATTAVGGSQRQQNRRKTILSDVSTRISPCKLTAWMGASGSGKTSLISVAAGLTKKGDVQDGKILANGSEGRVPKRLVGVVWQDDLLLSNLTVYEVVFFAARLKTPSSITNSQVDELVKVTLEELGLTDVADSTIGGGRRRGISGGERKRVSVAQELVVRPSLLFLDEPTSGLDATTAQELMRTLRDLADHGHAVVVVVHQPRTTIFELFDHLLLLSRGLVVYDGDASKVRAHLESCPGVTNLPAETGIADWVLDVMTRDERTDSGTLVKHWKVRKVSQMEVNDDSGREMQVNTRLSSLAELQGISQYETSFWTQLKLLTKRSIRQQRGDKLTSTGLLLTVVWIVLTSLIWWRVPDDTGRVFDRYSFLFFLLISQSNTIVVASMNVFHQERALLKRERAKKMYRVLPYFVAKTTADMTNNIILPLLFCGISYWVANLRPTATAFFKFLLIMYLIISTAQGMGLFLSNAIPSIEIGLMVVQPITLFFIIVGGFYVPIQNLNPVVAWASWASFARYAFSAQLINEFAGRDVPCAPGGNVPIAIGRMGVCPLPGEEILKSVGIEGISSNFWFNVGIVAVLQIMFRCASYVLLRRSR
mmetsp:Transcript_12902/g.25840  ORF Transcript_12902/g.25840 Transcript_12902/m.25840 type:complete len:642 (-) Transcript_12902:356-2281(-)